MRVSILARTVRDDLAAIWSYSATDDEPADILQSSAGREIRSLQEEKNTDVLPSSVLTQVIERVRALKPGAPNYGLKESDDGLLWVCDLDREAVLILTTLDELVRSAPGGASHCYIRIG